MDNNIKSVIAGLSQDLQEILVSESPLQQRIDCLINELVERTYYSAYADQVEVKPFYDMSREIIRYVLANPERTTNIDHAAFSRLVINFTDLYYLYGQIEGGATRTEDLTIFKALEYALNRVESGSLLSARLLLSQACLYQAAFYYNEAREKIAAAESIIDNVAEYDTPERVALYVVKALFYENYGDSYQSFSTIGEAYRLCVKICLEDWRCFIAMYIYYQLMLVSDEESAEDWKQKVPVGSLSENNVLQVFYRLGNALSSVEDYSRENELLCTEAFINSINYESPLLARLWYVRSITTQNAKQSNSYYLSYAERIAQVYCSTDAAFKIYYANEVVRFTRQCDFISAKNLIIDQLDSVNVISTELSYSTRLEVLSAYIEFHLADEKYLMLADAYTEEAISLLEQMWPSQDLLNKCSHLFKDSTVPASLLDLLFDFYVKKIEALVLISKKYSTLILQANGYDDIHGDINQLVKDLEMKFPYRRSEIEIVESYTFTDPYKCCKRFREIVESCNTEETPFIALIAARYAKKLQFIYESCEFYHMAVNSDTFMQLNADTRSSINMEYANALADCSSPKAFEVWDHALLLTQDSEKANIYYALAIANYERGEYFVALMNIKLCLTFYEKEEGLVDEHLAKILSWEATIECALGQFTEAKDSVMRGLEVCPQCYKDSLNFDLRFNYIYALMASEDYITAREELAKIKKLATSKKEYELIDSLCEILQQPLSQRKQYFMQNMWVH